MNDLRWTGRKIQAGSAARDAEQEAKELTRAQSGEQSGEQRTTYPTIPGVARAATVRVSAGSAAKAAEDARRVENGMEDVSPLRRTSGISLRVEAGHANRLRERLFPGPSGSPAYQPSEIAPVASSAGPAECAQAHSSRATETAISNTSTPGRLRSAAAQLQSRMRAFLSPGRTS